MKKLLVSVCSIFWCLLFVQSSLHAYIFIAEIDTRKYHSDITMKINCSHLGPISIDGVPMEKEWNKVLTYIEQFKPVTLQPGLHKVKGLRVPWITPLDPLVGGKLGILFKIPASSERYNNEIHEWGGFLQYNRKKTYIQDLVGGWPESFHLNVKMTVDSSGKVTFQRLGTFEQVIGVRPFCDCPGLIRMQTP